MVFVDRPGDRLGRVQEGGLLRHPLRDVAAVEALDDPVHGAEQDAALAVDVRLVLGLQRRLEGVGRAERHRPAERVVGRLAVDVLVDGEAGVDAGAVHFLPLHVEPAHRRSHPLRADGDDVHVGRELGADVLEVAEQETVREAQRRARAQALEHLGVELGLGGVGDQQKDDVRLLGHREHLAQRAVRLGEARLARVVHRRRPGAQADLHLDPGPLQRVAQVLRLRRPLRAPADDADLLDAREGLRQQRKQVAATLDDLLAAVAILTVSIEKILDEKLIGTSGD